MARLNGGATVIYPVLGTDVADLWFVRVSGCGLGNCFYTYFHAVVMADRHRAAIIAPPWFSLKLGPLLRGERSKRLYWRMFKPHADEIRGLSKLLALLRSYRKRVIVKVGGVSAPEIVPGALNFVVSSRFTFLGLHDHRASIRKRLLATINDPVPVNHCWGGGDYIAVHIRLGDFTEVPDHTLTTAAKDSVRIPMSWYVNLMRALRNRFPDKRVLIFSDGDDSALRPLLDLGAQPYRSGSDMTDLLAMSGASILVGSNSTYSRWAAFLGNMPSIWLKAAVNAEKPSAPETPILYVPLDSVEPALWE
jgi:Glycosyl transferase family 11